MVKQGFGRDRARKVAKRKGDKGGGGGRCPRTTVLAAPTSSHWRRRTTGFASLTIKGAWSSRALEESVFISRRVGVGGGGRLGVETVWWAGNRRGEVLEGGKRNHQR